MIKIAQLIFFEKGHIYEMDGEQLPSVSELTRFISREVYGDVAQFRLDNAAERGAIKLSFDAAHLRLRPLSDREAPGDDAEDDDEFPRMQALPKKET